MVKAKLWAEKRSKLLITKGGNPWLGSRHPPGYEFSGHVRFRPGSLSSAYIQRMNRSAVSAPSVIEASVPAVSFSASTCSIAIP